MAKVIWIFNLFGGLLMLALILHLDALIMSLILLVGLALYGTVECPEAKRNAKM